MGRRECKTLNYRLKLMLPAQQLLQEGNPFQNEERALDKSEERLCKINTHMHV